MIPVIFRRISPTMASFSLVVLGEQALVGTGIIVDVKSNWVLAKANESIIAKVKQTWPPATTLPPLLLSSTANGDSFDGGRTLESYGINESTPIYVRTVPAAGAYSHYLAAIFAFSRLND